MGAIDTYVFTTVLSDGTIEVFFSPKNFVNDLSIENVYLYCHKNILYIVNENNFSINELTIFDLSGSVLWQGKPRKRQLALNVVNGIYIVRIAANNQFSITKIFIQR